VTSISYDHLGCGKSAKPRSPPAAYHPDEMTADLHEILQTHTKVAVVQILIFFV
jgi:pimeloyl-ACP methyl ester carboxylesterase